MTAPILIVAAVAVTVSCAETNVEPALDGAGTGVSQSTQVSTITLGDVDADDPAEKVARFQPLADYLARGLEELGIEAGAVAVPGSIVEMAKLMRVGAVDLYFDSAYPVLEVRRIAGAEILLRRWKDAAPSYWGTFIALAESGITSVDGFLGKTVAFEEPQSTSGFLLPAGTLLTRGFTLRRIESAGAAVDVNEIGYIFSGDEENTIELVLDGKVSGGGISNQDYEELPAQLRERIVAFGPTIAVPRQLVAVRAGLDPAIVTRVEQLLVALEMSDEGRQILSSLKDTVKFDRLPADAIPALEELTMMIGLMTKE